jgi:hypothetical protein
MNYGVIQNQSETRKIAVSNQVESVCQRYEETQAVVRPLISYFSDIKKALGTDLTLDGVFSVREIVRKASENTGKIQLGLAQLANDLSVSGNRLATTVVPRASAIPASSDADRNQVDAGLH